MAGVSIVTVSDDPNVTRAWEVLVTSAEWRTIEKHINEHVLPRAFSEACSRADQPGRDWLAGRAAVIQQLVLDTIKLRQIGGRSQMPLVRVGSANFGG